jgi:hypothetical protein
MEGWKMSATIARDAAPSTAVDATIPAEAVPDAVLGETAEETKEVESVGVSETANLPVDLEEVEHQHRALAIARIAELIRCIDRDILRPIAQLNFGRSVQYEIRPRSLVETYAAMFGQREQFRTPGSRQTPTVSEEKFE